MQICENIEVVLSFSLSGIIIQSILIVIWCITGWIITARLFCSNLTADSHNDSCYVEEWCEWFAEQEDGEQGTDEGGKGIVGTGLGGSDGTLGIGVADKVPADSSVEVPRTVTADTPVALMVNNI